MKIVKYITLLLSAWRLAIKKQPLPHRRHTPRPVTPNKVSTLGVFIKECFARLSCFWGGFFLFSR